MLKNRPVTYVPERLLPLCPVYTPGLGRARVGLMKILFQAAWSGSASCSGAALNLGS